MAEVSALRLQLRALLKSANQQIQMEERLFGRARDETMARRAELQYKLEQGRKSASATATDTGKKEETHE